MVYGIILGLAFVFGIIIWDLVRRIDLLKSELKERQSQFEQGVRHRVECIEEKSITIQKKWDERQRWAEGIVDDRFKSLKQNLIDTLNFEVTQIKNQLIKPVIPKSQRKISRQKKLKVAPQKKG